MEYDSSWFRPAEFILLLLSTILQIVSISTPWWYIETHTERPSTSIGSFGLPLNATMPEERLYDGIFYSTKCNASVCETRTLHDRYVEDPSGSYHVRVMEQVTVMVAFVITMVCLPFQVRMLRSKYSQFLFTTVSNGLSLSFAGGLMIRHLMHYYVIESDAFQRSKDDQYFEVTLPYGVLLYTIAFVLSTLVVMLYAVEVFRMRQSRNREDQLMKSDDVVMTIGGIDNSVNLKNSWSSLT